MQRKNLAGYLGLPKAIIANCILIPPDAPLLAYPAMIPCSVLEGAAREGIPQGSRVSGLVASLLLGPALGHFAPTEHCTYYGDDVAMAVSGKTEASAFMKALIGELAHHPCGPFLLKRCLIEHTSSGIEFLKYRHTRDALTGEVHVRPCGKSYHRFLRKVGTMAASDEGLQALPMYMRHWVKAFPRWETNHSNRTMLRLSIAEAIANANADHKSNGNPD